MVDITPGDSGANKGFWREQLRDRFGKFVEMGGMVMFDVRLPGVDGIVQGIGKFIGNAEPGLARIQVLDNSRIPKGVYLVKPEDITAIEAVLPDAYVEEKLEEVAKKIKLPRPADRKREREALGWYTDNGYWDANKFLREGVPLDTVEDEENLAVILEMIDQSVTTEDMTLYRGRPVKSEERAAALAALKPGDKITDRGIMSTSEDRLRAKFYTDTPLKDVQERVFFEIDLPAGSRALKIEDTDSSFRGEHEVLLPPNTEFTIQDNFVDDTGVRRIKVKVLTYVEEPDVASNMYDEFFDGGMIDLRALRNSESEISPYDLDMFSGDQVKALERYGQAGHRGVNKILRGGEPISADDQKLIDSIDAAIEENGEVFSAARIFRGDTPSQSSDYYKFLEGLTEGKTVNFPGYFSASNDAQIAFSEFGPGQGGSDDDASNSHLGSTFFWSIDIPENGKAMAMPEGLGYGQGAESEVILPRNTQLKIIGVKKVEQLDDEGNPTGNYNYFIHAGQQIGATPPEPETTTQEPVSYPDRDHFDVPPLTPKTTDEILALSYYTGETKKYANGHKIINTYLRTGKHYDGVNSPETQAYVLKQIDALQKLVNSQTINKNTKTFRYQEEVPEGLKAGDVWSSDGFLSTSTATTMQGDQIVETEFASLPVQMEVNIPAGFRGGAVDTTLGRDEGEVLLPPRSKFVVQSIEEVDGKTKISLLLVEQDEWAEPEPSGASNDNAKLIAEDLEAQPLVRFLERVGPRLGSNEGGTFKDSIFTGKDYYVKTPKSETHRRNEMLASALYRLANVGSAGVRFGSDADGVEKTYSEIIQGKLLADTPLTPEIKKQIQENFAIDAWLSNWDVAGLGDDNIVIGTDGKPYRIDMGGALLFRAQGAPKGEAFGDEVTEIDTLRDPERNSATAAIFGDMTYSELVASASKLLDISTGEIDILVDATFDEPLATQVKNKLKARRNSILSRFNLLDGSESAESSSTTEEPMDYSSIDYKPSEFNDVTLLEPANSDQDAAVKYYTGDYKNNASQVSEFGHAKMNTYLRSNQWYPGVETPEEKQRILENIESLKALLNSTTIDEDIKLVRYQWDIPDGLDKIGEIWTSNGFLSTSTFFENGLKVDTSFARHPIVVEINIPKGSRGGAVPDGFESEVLLPPGSRFIVQNIERLDTTKRKVTLLLVGQDG